VTELTGIADEMVEGAPPFEALEGDLHSLLQDAHLAGYNFLQYDVPLLKAEYDRHGLGRFQAPTTAFTST
jgi:DNA polymerase-3 subunit epsilon